MRDPMNVKFVTCCFRLSHDPPPHSHSSLTRLAVSVAQFPYLLLTVFPYATPPNHQRFLECKQFKFKTDGTELPATDANNHSLCCTNNIGLQLED